MTNYLREKLWETILQKSISSEKTIVVSPYIGTNIEELIRLKKDDVVVCYLNEESVKSGSVNPHTLEQLFNAGVKIFSHQKLHSKIYLFDSSAIVGSANLSTNSNKELHESGIYTDKKRIIEDVKKEIEQIIENSNKISIDHIEALKKFFKRSKREKDRINSSTSDFWVTSTEFTDFTKNETKKLELTEKFYHKSLKSKHYELHDIRLEANDELVRKVKIGEKLLEIYKEEDYYYKISEPMTILGIEDGPSKKSKIEAVFLRLEKRKASKEAYLKDLNKTLKPFKIKNNSNNSKITEHRVKSKILRFFG